MTTGDGVLCDISETFWSTSYPVGTEDTLYKIKGHFRFKLI